MSILSVTIGNMRRTRGTGLQLAGIIKDASVRYSLYVSPRIGGQYGATSAVSGSGVMWKDQNTAGPTGVQTLTNGLNATNVMISANTANGAVIYPAADFAKTARSNMVGGYNDWYIPARDELELCYRNLKPNTDPNLVGTRPVSTYPGAGDTLGYGTNANSDPVAATYTTTVPAQTTVTAFQTSTGTGEGFVAGYYWSSTEFSAAGAWKQGFVNGSQSYGSKTGANYVRLVRRIAA